MFHLYSLKFYTQDQNPVIEDSHPKIIMGFIIFSFTFINFCKKRQLEYAVPHLDTIQFAASVSVVNSLQEHIITNINTRNDVYKLGNTFRLLKMIHPGDIYDTNRMLTFQRRLSLL